MQTTASASLLGVTLAESPVLRMRGIAKAFGGLQALKGAEFAVGRPGEIHTLVGENGSGKSTLLGILSGQLAADEGTVEVFGERVEFRNPQAAIARGIVMVSQETSIAPDLTVAENILMGRQSNAFRWLNAKRMHQHAAGILEKLDLRYNTRTLLKDMRPDQQQMVEIARAISIDARLVVLDEPTSCLTEDEVERLFVALDRLRNESVAIVFVSHRLPEVFQVSDAITVLRDGLTVASGPASEFTIDSLVEAMVGHAPPVRDRHVRALADRLPLLTVTNLSIPNVLQDICFDVRPGEVVGIAGLVGSGRTELLQAIFGARPTSGGGMTLGGKPYRPTSPRAAINRGVAYVPPDRKTAGLVLAVSIGQNLSMVDAAVTGRVFPSASAETQQFETATSLMRLRAASPRVVTQNLSGGNQQKVALGKWFVGTPDLLLLDEPTRGVDVAAKADIYSTLRAAAENGAAVVVSSSENPELIEICDRILVLLGGKLVGSLSRSDASQASLTRLAGGHL